MTSAVTVTSLPGLDLTQRFVAEVPRGTTLAAIVALAFPHIHDADLDRVRVVVGDMPIPRDRWHLVRPKSGTTVVVRAVAAGDLLKNILSIAVTVAAVALGQFYLAPLVGGGLAGSLVTGATLLASQLLLRALVPPSQPKKSATDSPTYSIQGWQNTSTPDGVVPAVLGRHRVAPVYASSPYTEAIGNDRYITALFLIGYGPLSLTDFRIGDTPIDRYSDLALEVRAGNLDDLPVSLYPQQVIEEQLSIEVKNGEGPVSRFTAIDATEAAVDITFPSGITGINKQGKPVIWQVNMRIRMRPETGGDWIDVALLPIADKRQKAKTISYRFTLPDRGRWEIEVGRATQDDPEDQSNASTQVSSRSDWTSLRSFRPEYPIAIDRAVALAAVRVRATGQLNGTLDTFNLVATSICPDWTGSTWVLRETRNPASLFRHVLTGPASSYPLTGADTYGLEEWHDFCAAHDLTYDRVHDYESSVFEVLTDIAAAGRATPHDRGNAWGVVIDRIMTTIASHISPRNSWGFQGERQYGQLPDAFRVSFKDESNDYEPAERIVPRPDFVGFPSIAERIEMPGVTNPDMVWKEARRRWYELFYRPDTYTVNQDFEHLVNTRGDLVRLSHDVLDRVQRSARVTSVSERGRVVLLDDSVTMEAGSSYACRFRREDGSSLLRQVETTPGGTVSLLLTGTGDAPKVGDLALFGTAGRETAECIVKGIEATENLSARITLIDHAPQIQTLVDAEVPPAWSGRVGAEVSYGTAAPLPPIITAIVSGKDAAFAATITNTYPVVILVQPGAGETTELVTYVAEHRLQGASGWQLATGHASEGNVRLAGYDSGDAIELRAYAVSRFGVTGARSDTFDHVVASGDPIPPDPPTNVTAVLQGSEVLISWTNSRSANQVAAEVLRAAGATAGFADAEALEPLVYGAPNSSGSFTDAGLTPGSYRYWVVALDDDDPSNASTPAGPATLSF